MRTITKGKEPPSLVEHRLKQDTTFDNLPAETKQILRASLVSEQRGLCCYCLCRIRAEARSMKIEHWKAQSKYPEEQLAYANLLAACLGNEGQPPEYQTCDTKKADNDLSRNPAEPIPRLEDMVYYTDGIIESKSNSFNKELATVLNLNSRHLVNARKSVVSSLTLSLRKLKQPQARRKQIQRWYDFYSGKTHNDDLEPYCTVLTYFLGKELNRNPRSANQ